MVGAGSICVQIHILVLICPPPFPSIIIHNHTLSHLNLTSFIGGHIKEGEEVKISVGEGEEVKISVGEGKEFKIGVGRGRRSRLVWGRGRSSRLVWEGEEFKIGAGGEEVKIGVGRGRRSKLVWEGKEVKFGVGRGRRSRLVWEGEEVKIGVGWGGGQDWGGEETKIGVGRGRRPRLVWGGGGDCHLKASVITLFLTFIAPLSVYLGSMVSWIMILYFQMHTDNGN